MDDGRFDDLPYQGERLPLEDDRGGRVGEAFRILRNANVAPAWIEADKGVRRLLDRLDTLVARAARSPGSAAARRRDRATLVGLVSEANAAIAQLNAEAPTDRQHRRPLDLGRELARLDAAADR